MKMNVFKAGVTSSAIACATTVARLYADTNKVQFPENYRSTFVRYTSVDKVNKKNPQKTKMRYFYVSPQSLFAANAG
ncbi:MAG: hypothetical protein ACI9DC_002412 [Gammaproteobacteria bacterium]|jgi:hypothetical protein